MTARAAELWRAACECCLQSADARLRWAPDFARWSQVPPNCKLHRVPVGGSSARLNTPAFLRERLLLLPRAASHTAPLQGGARTNKPEGARSEQWDECCSPQPCLPHAAYSSGSGEPWPPPQPQGGVQHSTRQAHPVRVQAAPGNRCKIKPQRRELPRLELARKGASPFYSQTNKGWEPSPCRTTGLILASHRVFFLCSSKILDTMLCSTKKKQVYFMSVQEPALFL